MRYLTELIVKSDDLSMNDLHDEIRVRADMIQQKFSEQYKIMLAHEIEIICNIINNKGVKQ
jgi:hypothetical protein